MKLQKPRIKKLIKSAAIGMVAIGSILLLKDLFPSFDFVQYETALLTAISMWLVNTVKESLRTE